MPAGRPPDPIAKHDYEVLAAFRSRLRRFLRFSEAAAKAHGLTPQQHQLLLAIKGLPGRGSASIAELAGRLERRHHSVVGLLQRCEAAGLVERRHDPEDGRVVRVSLTHAGEKILHALTAQHRLELHRMRGEIQALAALLEDGPPPADE